MDKMLNSPYGHISYYKFWALLEDYGMRPIDIRRNKIINERALQSMRHNGSITTDTICKICNALGCQPSDIMEYVPPCNYAGENNNQNQG